MFLLIFSGGKLTPAPSARSGTLWVGKFGYQRVPNILVLRKSSVPYLRSSLHVSRGEISHFKQPRILAVTRIATRTFRKKRQQQSRVFRLSFNVYTVVYNRERAGVRGKKQSRRISLEEKHENFKRRRENEKY